MKPKQEEMDPSDFRMKLLTQEIQFAKILAGNEFNAAIKEKHIKKLGSWLKNRTACSQVFSDKDCLRIWKGLFYSMWMSDKPLPQESLAKKMAGLLHSFDNIDSSLQFFAMFLKIMALEWNGIDQWRIDKFLMLVRKLTRDMLRIIQSKQWSDEAIKKLNKKLSETILGTEHVPRGLFMHFVELFFEEVGKISNGEIEADRITELLQPFMFYVASQSDYKLIQFVVRSVFNYLLFQSESGREYKEEFDAWKSMGFPGKSIDDLVLEESEENGTNDESDSDSDADDGAECVKENGSIEPVLDPRAGRVDVVMPEIKFDANEIVSQLEDLKYKKFTRVRNRKCLDRVITTYKKFAGGEFPIVIKKLKVNLDDVEKPNVDEKAIDLLEFENELFGEQRELKKTTKRKRKRIVNNSSLYDEFQAKSNKIAKIKQNANAWTEEDIPSDEAMPSIESPAKKLDKNKPKDEPIESKDDSTVATPKKRKSIKADVTTSGKKPKSNGWEKPLEDGEVEYVIPSKKLQLNGAPRVTITKDSIITQNITPSKKSKTEKTKSPSPNSLKPIAVTVSPKQVRNVQKSPLAKNEINSTPKAIEKPKLQNGTPKTSEKKVKSASELTQSTNSTPTTGIIAENVTQITSSTPNSALLSAERRVKIAFRMNRSQEVTEYMRQLKQSPMAPYDSAKKPLKGALKPNLTPSPINPFYKKLIGLK